MTGLASVSSRPSAAPDEDLFEVAARAAAGTGSSEALFRALLVATVYCERPQRPGFLPLPAADPADDVWDKPTGVSSLRELSASAGQPRGLIPVFTSLEELEAFAGECDWFSTSGADLLSLLPPGFDLVLDPAGDHPLRLNSTAWQAQSSFHISFRHNSTDVDRSGG